MIASTVISPNTAIPSIKQKEKTRNPVRGRAYSLLDEDRLLFLFLIALASDRERAGLAKTAASPSSAEAACGLSAPVDFDDLDLGDLVSANAGSSAA